jgi:RNA polymerase sigma factor (sigma-70 family)
VAGTTAATHRRSTVLKRSMDTDVALASRLARDLEAGFPDLVDQHQDRLYTIALRLLGDRRDAEEVAQDAFVRAFRAMQGYRRDRILELRLRPWLASIAVNLARNRRRRAADRQPPSPLEPMLDAGFDVAGDGRSLPDVRVDRRETQRDLAAALLRLTPSVRAAVVLRHVDGLSVAETAAALGRPEGTIKAQVHRGLRDLRAVLEADPGQPTQTPNHTRAARLLPALEALR